jgi:hypothetical protein
MAEKCPTCLSDDEVKAILGHLHCVPEAPAPPFNCDINRTIDALATDWQALRGRVRELEKERLSDEGMEYLRANWLNQDRARTQPVIDVAKQLRQLRDDIKANRVNPIYYREQLEIKMLRLCDAVAALEDDDKE